MTNPKEKNKAVKQDNDEKEIASLNKNNDDNNEEIDSDGSGEAFLQTERVVEDNFDDLKEK